MAVRIVDEFQVIQIPHDDAGMPQLIRMGEKRIDPCMECAPVEQICQHVKVTLVFDFTFLLHLARDVRHRAEPPRAVRNFIETDVAHAAGGFYAVYVFARVVKPVFKRPHALIERLPVNVMGPPLHTDHLREAVAAIDMLLPHAILKHAEIHACHRDDLAEL